MTTTNARTDLLREAETLVNGDRNIQYGDPNIDFKRTAAMWQAYLGAEVTAEDVGWMMAMLKASRNRHQKKRDNYADAAGYIACAYDCSLPEAEAEAEAESPFEGAWVPVASTDLKVGDVVRTTGKDTPVRVRPGGWRP